MPEWTPIATRSRTKNNPLWSPVPKAPMTIEKARKAHDAGRLLMAHRHINATTVELVVMKPKRPQPRRNWFQEGAGRWDDRKRPERLK